MGHRNVVWLCAGRPERSLPGVFSSDRFTHVFLGGMLPPMKADDIRGLLIEGTGSRKYDLVLRDEERVDPAGGSVVANAAVDAVVERAKGLPLCVHFVVQDIPAG